MVLIRQKFLENLTKLVYFLFIACISATTMPQTLPKVGTQEIVGKVNNISIEALVQSPSAQETPLQIVCVFEYTEGDIFTSPPALPKELNGLLHVDAALHGLITELRKTNKFEGKDLETLLITPPPNTIPAKKLLLIGLGNRNAFKEEKMRMIGVTGMREALRLGVSSYTHASDVKDGGVDSITGAVTGYVTQGALEGYKTQQFLKGQNASENLTVNKVTILTGPAFFEDSIVGIKKAIENFNP
ncbi:M17 family peptidase N-terminal domain-containing protein [Parachlamydia acanthamoebae]|nr:M17 family peptidase N-terminal domain-containing protein [Parachlamydia acanthamoebae]